VVRRGLIVTFVCLLVPGAAFAQRTTTNFTGFATVLIGGTHGGDAADTGWTPGASVAVIEANGWGAEIDLGHAREFDSSRFEESGITTLMFNATGVWSNPTALVRPYLVVGAGLIRVRACPVECVDGTNRTDAGFDAGAGAFVIFNEIIGARFDMRYFRYLQRHDDLPLTDNGFFDFWRTSIGITFQWPVR
jgi:hypothetical protein